MIHNLLLMTGNLALRQTGPIILNKGKEKKKGKASSQNQQLHFEDNDTSENGQDEQRPNEGTIIVGVFSRAAKRRVTVTSFPGATIADMVHYLM